jgi:hypothetical protein
VRRRVAPALLLAMLLAFASTVRAEVEDGPTSRIGVALMMVCGLALKALPIAPVPWAGVAVLACGAGLLDAALSPDAPAADPPSGH